MRGLEIAELLLLAALWGGSFLFMRIAAPVLGPVWLIEFRVLLAGLALLPVLVRFNLWHEVRRHWISLFIVGCINSAIPFSLLAFASVSLPAGFTSILNATAPLFGTIVAFVWLKERLTIARMIGFVLGFMGVVILIGWKAVSFSLTGSGSVSQRFWLVYRLQTGVGISTTIIIPYKADAQSTGLVSQIIGQEL